MKPSDALNQFVSKQLAEAFGKGIAARIIFSARDATSSPVVGLDASKFNSLVEAIARDDRVQQHWGEFGASKRLQHWKRLVE